MTGLDVEKDQILEMACLITDCDLNVLAEVRGPGGTQRASPAGPRRFQGMLEQSNPGGPRLRPRWDPLLHTGSVGVAPERGDLRHSALCVSRLKLPRPLLVFGTKLLHASKLFFPLPLRFPLPDRART